MLTLLAQARTGSELPTGTALLMVVFFGAVGLVALGGLFASKERLESMAEVIGTKNTKVARIVCGLVLLFCTFAVIAGIASLLGLL